MPVIITWRPDFQQILITILAKTVQDTCIAIFFNKLILNIKNIFKLTKHHNRMKTSKMLMGSFYIKYCHSLKSTGYAVLLLTYLQTNTHTHTYTHTHTHTHTHTNCTPYTHYVYTHTYTHTHTETHTTITTHSNTKKPYTYKEHIQTDTNTHSHLHTPHSNWHTCIHTNINKNAKASIPHLVICWFDSNRYLTGSYAPNILKCTYP